MDEKVCSNCANRCESGNMRNVPHCTAQRGRPAISKIVLPPAGCSKFKPKGE